MPNQEQWRAVAGWPYEVSDHGRVRRTTGSDVNRVTFPGRIVKPSANPNGYLHVNMTCDGRRLRAAIHILVLEAFDRPRASGDIANHIDGVKTNNARSNLEWTTHGGNMEHSAATGLHSRGERQHLAKLTADQVREIVTVLRADRSRGTAARLARRYGVTPQTIGDIKRGHSWSHITGIQAGELI